MPDPSDCRLIFTLETIVGSAGQLMTSAEWMSNRDNQSRERLTIGETEKGKVIRWKREGRDYSVTREKGRVIK